MIACDNGHGECTRSLTSLGANINLQDNKGQSALMRLCNNSIYRARHDIFLNLLERGTDVNTQDQSRKTALMIASAREKVVFAAELLKRGAKLNMQDSEGNTALIIAFKAVGHDYNNSDLVELLIRKGADINLQNLKGKIC